MTLAHNYATVLKDGSKVAQVLAHMKAKGHLSLLPQVVRILSREIHTGEVVTVAHEKDATHFKHAKVVIDPRVVGGHIHRNGSTVTDASYRTALVTLYKAVTQN